MTSPGYERRSSEDAEALPEAQLVGYRGPEGPFSIDACALDIGIDCKVEHESDGLKPCEAGTGCQGATCCRPRLPTWRRPRWKVRGFVRHLQRALPARLCQTQHQSPTTNGDCKMDEGDQSAQQCPLNTSTEAPLMPLPSSTEAFWGMRPLSDAEDGSESEPEQDDKLQAKIGNMGTSASRGLLRFGKTIVGTTKWKHASSIPDVMLPGTGLHYQDCVTLKPDCLLPNASKVALPTFGALPEAEGGALCTKTIATDVAQGARTDLTRTASAPELEVFGIERQFEIAGGGAGWVRTAAEEQPQNTVSFPAPPDHAGARVFHSGHHARWRRSLQRVSQQRFSEERRSRSWPPKSSTEALNPFLEGSPSMDLPETVTL